jgi:hypothetical protein
MDIKYSGSKRSFNLTRRELLKLSAATGGALGQNDCCRAPRPSRLRKTPKRRLLR